MRNGRSGFGRSITAVWLAGAVALAVLASSASASAEPKASVSVTVIHARKGPPHLHASLQPMWDTLRQTFGDKFSYYEVLDRSTRTVDSGGAVEVKLPNGERFAAIFNGVTPEKGLLRVNVEMGEFRTKVRIHDGGVFFQAGAKHDGGTLVVAVRAALEKN